MHCVLKPIKYECYVIGDKVRPEWLKGRIMYVRSDKTLEEICRKEDGAFIVGDDGCGRYAAHGDCVIKKQSGQLSIVNAKQFSQDFEICE